MPANDEGISGIHDARGTAGLELERTEPVMWECGCERSGRLMEEEARGVAAAAG